MIYPVELHGDKVKLMNTHDNTNSVKTVPLSVYNQLASSATELAQKNVLCHGLQQVTEEPSIVWVEGNFSSQQRKFTAITITFSNQQTAKFYIEKKFKSIVLEYSDPDTHLPRNLYRIFYRLLLQAASGSGSIFGNVFYEVSLRKGYTIAHSNVFEANSESRIYDYLLEGITPEQSKQKQQMDFVLRFTRNSKRYTRVAVWDTKSNSPMLIAATLNEWIVVSHIYKRQEFNSRIASALRSYEVFPSYGTANWTSQSYQLENIINILDASCYPCDSKQSLDELSEHLRLSVDDSSQLYQLPIYFINMCEKWLEQTKKKLRFLNSTFDYSSELALFNKVDEAAQGYEDLYGTASFFTQDIEQPPYLMVESAKGNKSAKNTLVSNPNCRKGISNVVTSTNDVVELLDFRGAQEIADGTLRSLPDTAIVLRDYVKPFKKEKFLKSYDYNKVNIVAYPKQIDTIVSAFYMPKTIGSTTDNNPLQFIIPMKIWQGTTELNRLLTTIALQRLPRIPGFLKSPYFRFQWDLGEEEISTPGYTLTDNFSFQSDRSPATMSNSLPVELLDKNKLLNNSIIYWLLRANLIDSFTGPQKTVTLLKLLEVNGGRGFNRVDSDSVDGKRLDTLTFLYSNNILWFSDRIPILRNLDKFIQRYILLQPLYRTNALFLMKSADKSKEVELTKKVLVQLPSQMSNSLKYTGYPELQELLDQVNYDSAPEKVYVSSLRTIGFKPGQKFTITIQTPPIEYLQCWQEIDKIFKENFGIL